MDRSELILRKLRPEDEASFRKAVSEFTRVTPDFTFAFSYSEDTPFADYVKMVNGWSDGIGLEEKHVPSTFYVGVVNGIIVGRLSLRHCLNQYLIKEGGNIGYAVVPQCRGKGYATEMVRQALQVCKSMGMDTALITCDDDNIASARVIERCGGVLENTVARPDPKVPLRRYWIELELK